MSGWTRCLVACLGTLGISVVLLYAFLLSVDPYDSGKFGLFGIAGMSDRNTVTANASRARDQHFDSAIIGNSTALLLDPGQLSRETGLRFVQLSVVGGSPREEMAVLDFFLRHHARVGAVVVGADPRWCAHEENARPRDFPYWLYDRSLIGYAGRLFSGAAIEHAGQRVAIGLGLRARSDPTGTFNSEDVWPTGQFFDTNRPADPPLAQAAMRDIFPEVSKLARVVSNLPSEVAVVVLVPPTFGPTVPQPGTERAAEQQACSAALRKVVAGRPHSNFIDYRVDNALTRDRANFVDYIHYRPLIATKMGDGIAASIRDGAAANVDF